MTVTITPINLDNYNYVLKYTTSLLGGNGQDTSSWEVPSGVTEIQYLVVGGGGRGGTNQGNVSGGGGGGQVLTGTKSVTPGSTITIKIGSGQSASQLDDITAIAGYNGQDAYEGRGGASGNGYAGGYCVNNGAGGGGGAGAIGGNGWNNGQGDYYGGTGGIGLSSNITGTSTYYGGGGGGGGNLGSTGGNGGGGSCPAGSYTNDRGDPATGGGGSGARNTDGAAGGSGIVVIRYVLPPSINVRTIQCRIVT